MLPDVPPPMPPPVVLVPVSGLVAGVPVTVSGVDVPPVVPVPIEPVFEPGVLPGGFTAGEVVVFWSAAGVVGPEPLVPGCIG